MVCKSLSLKRLKVTKLPARSAILRLSMSCPLPCLLLVEGRLLSIISPFGRQAIHDPVSSNAHKLEHQSASAVNPKASILTGSGVVTGDCLKSTYMSCYSCLYQK